MVTAFCPRFATFGRLCQLSPCRGGKRFRHSEVFRIRLEQREKLSECMIDRIIIKNLDKTVHRATRLTEEQKELIARIGMNHLLSQDLLGKLNNRAWKKTGNPGNYVYENFQNPAISILFARTPTAQVENDDGRPWSPVKIKFHSDRNRSIGELFFSKQPRNS